MAPPPGTRAYTKAIVGAQMLAQIGAFALPALLPDYIARWDLSKTEAGWLVGSFFAAYVVMDPLLVALTDRVPPTRSRSRHKLRRMERTKDKWETKACAH